MHENIRVVRHDNGEFELTWPREFSAGPLDVHYADHPSALHGSKALVSNAIGSARVAGVASPQRPYFQLRAADGRTITVAERSPPVDGAVNFRDLGGYETENGQRVQWGRLYRSGHLSELSAAGLAAIHRLSISNVCDFRSSEERASENKNLGAGIKLESLEIPPGIKDPRFLHRVFATSNDPEDIAEAIREIMRSMVDQSAARFRRLFDVLLNNVQRNILLNCSAGKERTGIGTALVLTALGVPRETIYDEFMLSQVYFPIAREVPRVLAKYEVEPGAAGEALIMPLLETRDSYLRAAFDCIDEKYGGGLEFLHRCLDLKPAEIDVLRKNFTE